MDIIPAVHVERFEQLKPGDLFIHLDGKRTFYALKTQPAAKGDRSSMVLMGPSFTQDDDESASFHGNQQQSFHLAIISQYCLHLIPLHGRSPDQLVVPSASLSQIKVRISVQTEGHLDTITFLAL